MSGPDGSPDDGFKDADAASYDSAADDFDRLAERYTRPLAERLVELARLQPGQRVLDVGTGTGIVARAARRRMPELQRVVAVDLSAGMLERARSRGAAGRAAIPVCRTDAERLAFRDRSFDCVLSLFTLLHLPEPLVALREIFRVLRPGGRAAIGVGSGPSWASGRGIVEVVRVLPELLSRLWGGVLVAPDHLEARVEEMLPGPGADARELRTAWSRDDPVGALPSLLERADLEPVERSWEGRRARIQDPEEFWRIQATFSSKARKRLAAADQRAVRRVREGVLEEARRVLERGGRLVYPYGATLFVARRPGRDGG